VKTTRPHEYDDFARALLRSARGDRSARGAQGRTLGLLGVGAAGAISTATQAASAGAAGAAPVATTFGATAVVKLVGVAVAVGVVTTGAIGIVQHAPTPHPSATTAATTASIAVTPPVLVRREPAPAACAASSPPHPTSLRVPPTPSPPATTMPLAMQVRVLDDAKRAIASGNGPAALSLLDDFESRVPDSPVREEALALRVEALVVSGDKSAASRAADRFFALYPRSPYARRIRSLVGSSP
jgi:hypothetical protein